MRPACQDGRRHRRRPAGAGMRQGAARHEPANARGRICRPPDGDAGGRRRRPHAAPEDRRPGRDRPHAEEHLGDRRWRNRDAPPELCRRHAPGSRHGRLLGRHPPARRTGARLRAGSGRARRHRDRLRVPHLRAGCLRDWRMRAVGRQGLRPGCARLRDGAHHRQADSGGGRCVGVQRRRHEHQAQADGRGCRQPGRCAGRDAGQPQRAVHR